MTMKSTELLPVARIAGWVGVKGSALNVEKH